ncbi:hypothetical protein BV20DRAFT_1124877 [Pilatotrama ljubarskyi]|nr:hypothetical protein BV20DRAFT_1124877 [Pilatotrama ljubarskyi]
MKSYAPTVGEKRRGRYNNILRNVPVASGTELSMYEPLVDALNTAKLCPGLKFVTTAARGDPSDLSNEAVDIGLYPVDRAPQPACSPLGSIRSPPTDWSSVELCIECKTDSDAHDPFDDNNPDSEPTTDQRKNRTCIFMILLVGDCCRLIRFDRSGAIVTEKFNYKTKGDDLIEFLWRYSRWDAATRGHDPAAERIDPTSRLGKAMQARALKDEDPDKPEDYVRKLFQYSLDTRWSWWKLRIDDKTGPRFFLVGKPNFQAPGVAGRGTRGYVAVDANDIDGPFYYLKDAWRVVNRNVDKEGAILQYLNKKGVRHVPTLECHGDVSPTSRQTTKTQKLWSDLHKDDPDAKCPVKQHRHYRIVVKEVGQEMSQFTHSRQLVHALWCCIFAHSQAYKAGVIHRDISAGNVLLYYDPKKRRWGGLLNDWELSKFTESDRPEGRQLDRTGTWQFMSARALDNPKKQIVVEDEIESFFHVLLFLAIRYLPHNCDDVAAFMYDYFDDYRSVTGSYTCGSYKLLCMVDGSLVLTRDGGDGKSKVLLTFSWPSPNGGDRPAETSTTPHPLNHILKTILEWLKAYYALCGEPEKAKESGVAQPEGQAEEAPVAEELSAAELREKQEAIARNLSTHQPILDLLKKSLGSGNKWPAADRLKDQLSKKGHNPKADLKQPSANLPKGGSMHGNVSGAGPSLKRGSDEIDEPVIQPPPKRTRSQTRRSTRSTRRNP